eukprot:23103-Prymnesium_polylepis.1
MADGTRARRASDASGVPRRGHAPSQRQHGPRVRHAGVRDGGGRGAPRARRQAGRAYARPPA